MENWYRYWMIWREESLEKQEKIEVLRKALQRILAPIPKTPQYKNFEFVSEGRHDMNPTPNSPL